MSTFSRAMRVHFEDCDPAGIIFYPRFFALVNRLVEDWFADELGQSFKALHVDQRKGVPTVQFACDFQAPLRLGDTADMRLTVAHLGTSSCQLLIEARLSDKPAAKFEQTIVYTDLNAMKSEPWPEELRANINRFTKSAS
ncbi:MAG TPA: thioesterase family protein [Vitreimonas sp.]|nr:thioesterase family protein [Vitreimonas sp.]